MERGALSPNAAADPRSARDVEILRALAERIDARDAGAHNNLGVVYFRKGLQAEAIAAFERALAIDPRMGVAERNLRIAYSHEGYYERLVAELVAELAADPGDAHARARLARAYRHGGDADAAHAQWKELAARAPDDVDAGLALARAEAERGELEAGLEILGALASGTRDDPRVELQAGELLYQLGRPDDARARLEAALELDEELAAAHHMLAFVYGDLGLVDGAPAATSRAETLNPAYGRAEANLSLDSYSPARYEELVGTGAATPGLAEGSLAHYNLGLAFRERGMFAEAEREFSLAEAGGEDPFLVRQAQAELFLLLGDGARAAPLYDAALEIEADSPKLWNERGVAAHQLGDLEAAERAYRRALELDTSYTLARNNVAVARIHQDDPAEAEREFSELLQRPTAPGDVWRNYALALSRTGRHEAAEQAFRSALERDEGFAGAWAGLGTTLLALQRHEEARVALAHAVQLDPGLAEARYQLAFALSALGDYQGALRETRLALEIDPLFPAPRFRLLIDLQFEQAGVPAPELGGERRLEGDAGVDEFRFESEALSDLFASLSAEEEDADEDAGAAADMDAGHPGTAADMDAGRAGAAADPVSDADPAAASAPASSPAGFLERLVADPVAWAAGGAAAEGDATSGGPEGAVAAADPRPPADPLAAAERALARGDLQEAHAAARRAADAGAARAKVLLVRAQAFLRQGFAGEALERFESVLGAEAEATLPDGDRFAADLGCATALLDLDRSQEALAIAAALAADTGDPRALRAHGLALAACQRPAEAAEVLEKALETAADGRAAIALDAGHARLSAGRGADAERLFRVALSLEPDSPAALTGLGRALASLGHDDAAAEALREALGILPTYADAALALSGLERRGGDADRAIGTLASFLLDDPYHFGVLQRLGEVLAAEERPEDAAIAFRRILAFDPADARARDSLHALDAALVDAGVA